VSIIHPNSNEIVRREEAVERWEKASAVPLAILAVAFLGLWALQVLAELNPIEWDLVEGAILLIWGAFIIDFGFRFYFHTNKKQFLKSNVIEILAIAVPAFRFLRVLRVLMAVGILARVVQSLQGRVNIYIAIVLPLLTFSGALGVYEAEHAVVGSNITSFSNAFWWACVTVLSVGYGDYFPITWEGRAIAVVLMLGGIAMLSVVTANLASYFLSQARNAK
jgi:voltage-gated potassium channel